MLTVDGVAFVHGFHLNRGWWFIGHSSIAGRVFAVKGPTLRELREEVLGGPPFRRALVAALEADKRAGAQALLEMCRRHRRMTRARTAHMRRMVQFEEEARAAGFMVVAGVDEAGRGPLAGPIVAGAVILDEPVDGLDDSKKLSEAQREAFYEILHGGGHRIGVCVLGHDAIDRNGLQCANYAVMLGAVEALGAPPDFVLVDGFRIKGCVVPQKHLIKGDGRSMSIAAASIIAKVTRDRIMVEMDALYPGYGFAKHKGYATREHGDALRALGPSPIHRQSFAPVAEQLMLDLVLRDAAEV
jgi:ribonuclease HII